MLRVVYTTLGVWFAGRNDARDSVAWNNLIVAVGYRAACERF